MPVTLENRLRQMQIFNLDHEAHCQGGNCTCSSISLNVMDEHPRTGERAARKIEKRVPSSLTLLALEKRTGLPNQILRARDIQAAIAQGRLRVIEEKSLAN